MTAAASSKSAARRWLLPGLVSAVILACVAMVVVLPESADDFGFVGMILGFATAGAFYARRSRTLEPRERRIWRTLAIGPFLVVCGLLATAAMTLADVPIPAIGPIDTFFLGTYVVLIVALTMLARLEGGGREWLPTIIDALVGGISLAVLVWIALFHELMQSFSGGPWWQSAIAATYPILDVLVIVGLIIMVIRRSHFHFDLRLILLALGLGIQVFSDFVYLRSGIGATFSDAEPAWVLLLTASLFFVLSSAVVDRTPKKREFPEVDVPLWAIAWPYLLGAALLAVHVTTYRALTPGFDAVLVLDAVLAVGILIFVRQLIAIRRNQRRVERQRSDLVASVSHELRTPLTAIVGYLKLLDSEGDGFPEDVRREMIAEASAQAEHMSLLVSDLVMLARGVHRNLPLDITESSVSVIVNAAFQGVDPKGKSISVDLPVDCRATVDPNRVQQALSNLLSNAIRYGGDTAVLVCRVEGADLVFEMHDNGPGVPTRYEAAIWERFERGANRLNATHPGLGIGLAIVEAIAVSHGGAASYRRSARLGGACFIIRLPGCVAGNVPALDLVDTTL